MTALAEYKARLCPVCGGPAEECQTSENEFRFDVPTPTRCHRTTAIARAQKVFRENDPSPHQEALMWQAKLK